ncbi:MAG TPA: hypothetical protein VFC73_05280 [Syntrophomonadaceae bacterium]|nr:hypothetical protein [Syntrophomonadaceae bacterium]
MKKTLIISISILLSFCCFASEGLANDKPDNIATKKVIIYMIDNLSLNDITSDNTPYLWSLQEKGGIGLLNTITGGERTIKNACSTISAGKLAVGSNEAHLNFQAATVKNNEKVGDVFFRSTNFLPKPENIVVTNINIINRNNEQRRLGSPGHLGDSLHTLGLTTAVVGNSDRFDVNDRPGALILMNSRGIVDNGMIENNNTGSGSYWTDYALLHEQIETVIDNDVILVEYGDMTRLESMHAMFSKTVYQQERIKILSAIDKSIQNIDQKLATENTTRYILSPSPSRNAYIPSALLTPLIIVGPDNCGVLTSYSTRQDGIILLSNLNKSILSCFTTTIKNPIYNTSYTNSYNYLKELNKHATFNYTHQAWILTILISLLVLLVLIAIILLYKKKPRIYIESLLLLILSLPLVLLIMPLIPVSNRYMFVFLAIILCSLFTIITLIINKLLKIESIMVILFFTILTICLDLILGFDLVARSIMSYQIISGARYYGIGNEYMGVLIGATIGFATLYINRKYSITRLNFIAILFILIVFLIAFPFFGINVGGTITACIALSVTLVMFYKSKIRFRDVIAIIIGTGIIVSLMAFLDVSQPSELQSHLGKNINVLLNEGISGLFYIIIRKLEMHLQIINYRYLGWIFLVIFAAISLIIYRPNQMMSQMKDSFRFIYDGLKGIIIAAIIAFIFNDSGITAAATLSIYFVCILIYALVYDSN